ncbi:hypothetical protein F5148DRAFT_1145879 [Russula earlei]|uniref:Uncharacterized protein n=1 Tax=Russula earlei TaxID=71964 RepID=A0ACC0UMZ9_9AGAM|nr:hypothetical protein F5148DRAFT_1145879 [Russula earlei]
MAMPESPSSSQPQHGGAGDGKKVGKKEQVEPCCRQGHGYVAITAARSSHWLMGHAQDSWPSRRRCGHAQVVVIITTAVTQEETGMGGSIQGPVWKTVEKEVKEDERVWQLGSVDLGPKGRESGEGKERKNDGG